MKAVATFAVLLLMGALALLVSPAPPPFEAPPIRLAADDAGGLSLHARTVNGVLGDASFVAAFGRAPGPGDGEDLRLGTHLAYVERLLRARDVRHLSPALQAARARNLDRLHTYWTAGVFPRNTVRPNRRTPVFIDAEGRICAVGYLLEQDLGRAAAERVNGRYQTATIFEIDDPALAAWLATSGLTETEAAMIQPAYGPGVDYFYEFNTVGATVCNSNENPYPDFFHTGEFSVSEMERMPGIECEDSIDDVFESAGFSDVYNSNQSIRFEVTYSGIEEHPLYSELDFEIWRSPDGPTEGRLLFSIDGGVSFAVAEEFDITVAPARLFYFIWLGTGAMPGDDVIFAIEARGGTPSGSLIIGDLYGVSAYTPVELTSFQVNLDGSSATLAWGTSSETNNAGFEVQMRTDGATEFEALGFVEGHGTTTEARSYSYTVTDLDAGTHTFRLKQIDFDGAFEFSPEVEVTVGVPGGFALSPAYPNPFNPEAQFTLSVAQAQHVSVALYDALGRRVRSLFDGALDGGRTHAFTLDARGLASGLLVLRAVGETFAAAQTVTLLR